MIRIVGDGIAGLLVAEELARRGVPAFLVGERHEPPRAITALVHPFAGRSLAMSPAERLAWDEAVPVLESFVRRGWATRSVMRRPLEGDAGVRLLNSFERDEARLREEWGVEVFEDPVLGACLRYEPAYGVDMAAALRGLRAGHSYQLSSWEQTVLAPGARLREWVEGDDVRVFGGELAAFDTVVGGAISGRGVHAAPTVTRQTCAGSTWWTDDERMTEEAAASDLQTRLARVTGVTAPMVAIWSGWRCVYQPDRRPVVGRLDEETVVAGALGTRGWLWGATIARQAADALEGRPVRPDYDVARTSLRRIEP